MKNLEDYIEELTIELRQQFFSTMLYGPHVLVRADMLTKAAIKAGMHLKEEHGNP